MRGIVGALLWSLFLLLSVVLYIKEERRAVEELTGLCRLLSHLRTEIDCFLRPLFEIYATFEDKALESCGFLTVLREEGLSRALGAGKLHLKTQKYAPLLPFASSLGTRLLSEERTAIDDALRQMEALLAEAKRDAPRRERLHTTLFLSGGMLLLLLLI